MKPAAFAYFRADSLEAALRRLTASGGGAKLIAGGQSLGPMMNMRLATPAELIDLNDLTELAFIRDCGNELEIGALTRHFQIADSALVQASCPLLAQATRTIGHYAIRQRGTLGGSLAHADPAAQLSLVAVTLQASLELISERGLRRLRAADFFLSAMTTALASDEVIRSVRFPKMQLQEGTSFQLFNRRHGDYAIVAVAAAVSVANGQVTRLRLGINGVDAVPLSLDPVLQPWVGAKADADWIASVALAVRSAVTPEDDAQIPAVYRQELAQHLSGRALQRALARTQK